MNLGLSRNTAMVTGAGRGIGLAIVRALTAEGAALLVDRAVAELGAVKVAS
ncbi:SDR family NAD(P)-dependent oxidoreductase [Nonomuraea guangzhouensis]|uniref:SDR family NAD(P)-dependent oxidoreductase n=1 Tax=Nonomuraea guangzhouensis TaxID=1291555 RepID=A0ABW4G8V9_9ACTN|nr:SDR family NAD(P)-dependent oxidoreductase [Nonomuraea guangzhouensis]